jgi:hypothetical protein
MQLNILYLPYPNFRQSIACYSDDTLKATLYTVRKAQNNIRKESRYDLPFNQFEIWRAWHSHYQAFIRFALICFEEVEERGLEFSEEDKRFFIRCKVEGRWRKPQWVGWEALHSEHRSNLKFLGLCELSASRICLNEGVETSVFNSRVRRWLDFAGFPREIYTLDALYLTEMNSILDSQRAPYPSAENHYNQFGWSEEANPEIKRTALTPGEDYLC